MGQTAVSLLLAGIVLALGSLLVLAAAAPATLTMIVTAVAGVLLGLVLMGVRVMLGDERTPAVASAPRAASVRVWHLMSRWRSPRAGRPRHRGW